MTNIQAMEAFGSKLGLCVAQDANCNVEDNHIQFYLLAPEGQILVQVGLRRENELDTWKICSTGDLRSIWNVQINEEK